MSDLKKAAQQALEALETDAVSLNAVNNAASFLRAALELPEQEVKGCDHCNHPLYAAIKCRVCGRVTEPEQEPVAWCDIEEDGTIHGLRYWSEPGRREHALYTHPPRREWRSLSEEEIESLWRKWVGTQRPNYSFTRAIEAALKERNV